MKHTGILLIFIIFISFFLCTSSEIRVAVLPAGHELKTIWEAEFIRFFLLLIQSQVYLYSSTGQA